MTPHVPSKASVERCAEEIANHFRCPDMDVARLAAEAVLLCAVEECHYGDPDVFDGQQTIIELLQDQCRYEKERAEKAEAECLELRKALRDYEKNAGRFGRDGE